MDYETKKLTGRVDDHLVEYDGFYLLPQTLKRLQRLKQLLSPKIELALVSAFRSFEDQLRIWNEKAQGKRKLYDRQGEIINYSLLTDSELCDAMMNWSAVPGTSRHHWGSDIDVFDAKIKDKSQVKLTSKEYSSDFSELSSQLTFLIDSKRSEGFFRPYDADQGGVAPELWHLSDAHESKSLLLRYTREVLEENLTDERIELREQLLARREMIYEQFIHNITS